MLDLERIRALQVSGSKQIHELPQVEQDALIGYSALVAGELINFSTQNKQGIYELTNNAFRFGLALGINIKVADGQVLEK